MKKMLVGVVSLTSPPLFKGSEFEESDYILLNYNDFPSAMFALFLQRIQPDWDAAKGLATLSGTDWARVYFILFWLLGFFLFKLLISSILDAFLSEFERQKKEKQRGKLLGSTGGTLRKTDVLGAMFEKPQ